MEPERRLLAALALFGGGAGVFVMLSEIRTALKAETFTGRYAISFKIPRSQQPFTFWSQVFVLALFAAICAGFMIWGFLTIYRLNGFAA